MDRVDWENLPDALYEAVHQQLGPLAKVQAIAEGRRTALVAAAWTRSGDRLFLKGAPVASRAGEQLAREQAVAPYVAAIAPELIAAVEAAGWRLLVFEYTDGVRGDYSPASPDIPKVLDILAELDRTEVPSEVPLICFEARWSSYAPAGRELPRLAGSAVLHTDLNPTNMRVGDTVCLVDWAAASRGARFVNPADFVVCLIACGHTPHDAEAIAAALPAWQDADSADIDYYARTLSTAWLHAFWDRPHPWAKAIVTAAQRWVMHRRDLCLAAR
ncbi:hypothetical protein SAMN04489712_11598 [Thermomonospora echinospora]|uniref:Phosphotransferase enzyme family protein n=1 Tax=Thermomonospora echinospora TaxID=1992 RepID=A0A1H6DE81_9ACTN|nr:hypothetical protein [Thermomonospora echinospora]SEG82866.1 hypothetical protein SAMN04489712_11598 [Thermomonospora echinospora]